MRLRAHELGIEIGDALLAAETMTGRAGRTVHALPHDLLLEALA